jgi:diguanylate cyclase (GGDEF)-like protein
VARLQATADRASLWQTMLSMIGAVLAVMLLAVTFTHLVSRRLHAAVRDAEDRMKFLAHHDALTGLFNRATFTQALETTVARTEADGTTAALMCMDIDNFKLVNDTHGHAAGDAALRTLSDLLRKLVREGDPVARLGGDEFAVLLSGHNCELVATRVALSLQESFVQHIDGHQGSALGLSIGIASIPRDAQTATDAMHCADVALYQAKRNGKGRHVVYSSALGESLRERRRLEQDLRATIEAGQLQLAYQPIFDAQGRICSLEALARWEHPQRGWIPPSEFIAVAEESGLVVELGESCLTRARRDIDAWRAKGCATVPVALNVSAQQLRREEDRERFLAKLAALSLGPQDVEFELTESVMFEDLHNPASILVRLQSIGYTLAIDDFGTGYSSLAYLRRMRCRKLKIDRAFVRGVHADKDNTMLVDSIVRVAHSMNMLVVAEGVESAAEQQCLVDLGCDQFQGFGLSTPQFAEVIATMLDPRADLRPRGTLLAQA